MSEVIFEGYSVCTNSKIFGVAVKDYSFAENETDSINKYIVHR